MISHDHHDGSGLRPDSWTDFCEYSKSSGEQLLNQPVLFRYWKSLKIQMVVLPDFKFQIWQSLIYIDGL